MKPNYYAKIPADVRYNDKLSPNAKLLYGEITALASKKGVCWAQNKYFADLYKVDIKTASRWVKQLLDQKFITVKMIYKKDSKCVEQRQIKLTVLGGDKNAHRWGQKDPQGGDKNVQDNIIKNNNIKNNKKTNSATFKKVSDFSDFYLTAYDHILTLFPKELHPKTTDIKVKWLNVIRLADTKDKVNPRQLYYLIHQAKKDDFWKKVQFGLLSMRKTNSESGLRRIDLFKLKFGDDDFKILGQKPNKDDK